MRYAQLLHAISADASLTTLISFFYKTMFSIVCFVFYFFTMTVTSIGLSDNFINFVPSMFVFPK